MESPDDGGETDTNWRYRHNTIAVLEFVDVNVQESATSAWTIPSQDQASAADRMMVRGIDSLAHMPSD